MTPRVETGQRVVEQSFTLSRGPMTHFPIKEEKYTPIVDIKKGAKISVFGDTRSWLELDR
jgi:hypothetical protein